MFINNYLLIKYFNMKNNNLNDKLANFCSNEKEEQKEEVIVNKDGLFERVDYVNKKYITQDGRQLLKETLFN